MLKEETFHLRHGEQGMRKLNQTTSGREALQRAVDWMFLLTVEWFSLPDDLKKHGEQLDYGFKGHNNIHVNCACFGFLETRMTAPKKTAEKVVRDGEEIHLGIPEHLRHQAKSLIPSLRVNH